MLSQTKYKLLWITIFGIAMGYFEAAVVVYLRKIYSPDMHTLFPLKLLIDNIMFVELGREFFSLVMLLAVGMLAGRSIKERVAYFFYNFAIWDIFFYIFLKITINWPSSFFTWDILFLIPVAWVGPVIAPVIVSITFIIIALLIIYLEDRQIHLHSGINCFILELIAGTVIVVSFCWDFRNIQSGGMPNPFRWDIFLIGELLLVLIFFLYFIKSIACKNN